MHRGPRTLVVLLLALALVAVTLLALPAPLAVAANTVPFTQKFQADANGAILSVGNNLLTCPASASGCAAALAGASADNNGFPMVNLDADADPTTFNSSSSSLALPAGATVLWAGLYWGARLQAGTGGTGASAAAINQISFRAPGDAAYRPVPASAAAHDQFGPNSTSYDAYQRFADVTPIVQAAGNGAYWAANVPAATGADRYAGWALTVVYTAPGLPLRNLTVFDGFNVVGAGAPQNITVSGFQAPRSGTVDAQLTMVAYEGDLSQSGDFTRLNNTQLGTAVSSGSNFFDSTNDLNGTSVATRTPADRNMLGFDVKNLGASGAIPNSATQATFTFSSNGDVYYPGVVGLAINLYAPDYTASSKTVVNLNGNSPARPGDTLQYTLNYANTGQDAALGVVSTDPLPPHTTYVPGSLALVDPVTGATTSALSDAADGDAGEVAGGTVTVRLGSGATGTAGGRMACSGTGCTDDGTSRQSYTFQVTLDDEAGGTTVTNLATLGYRTETPPQITATYTTNPASVDVVDQADVAITKSMSPDPAPVGSTVTSTLTVTNNGPNVATGVTVSDPIPADMVGAAVVSPASGCSIAGGTLTCALGDLGDGQVATVTMTGRTASGSTASSLTNVATVGTTAFDPLPTNNVSSDTVTLTRQADLSISKTASPASAPAGSPVTWTLTVTNDGASDAANVLIVDALDTAGQATLGNATVTVSAGSGTSCTNSIGRAVRCAVSSLPAGATATMTVPGVLASGLAAGTTVADTATVSSATPDPGTGNNTATAGVTVTAPQADVGVTKTGPTSVVAGQQVTWTVTATNYGPSDAGTVRVTDAVPAGVTVTSIASTRGTCAPLPPVGPGDTVTCDAGTLFAAGTGVAGAAGGAVTITLTGTVAPDATGTLVNTASAATSAVDPVPGNDSASASSTVAATFDLAVAKSANRTSLPGADPPETRPVSYVVTVTNQGPSTATGVVVTDLVPSEPTLTLVSAVPTAGGSCSGPAPTADPAHDRLTCTLSTPIAPGASQTVKVDMLATTNLATIGDPVTETVSVTAPGDDQTKLDNNTASWTLSGTPVVDLALGKSAPPTVTAGAMVPYGFVLTNLNPATDPDTGESGLSAPAPIVVDTLPPGVTLVPAGGSVGGAPSATPTWCTGDTNDPQTVTCAMPGGMDVAAGASRSFQVSVRIDASTPPGTTLVNDAHASATGTVVDPAPANNAAQASSTVVADADVAVTAFTVTPTGAYTGAGSQRAVHLTLTNNGPSTAQQVTFRLARTVDAFADLPPALAQSCTANSRELVCTVAATLAPGDSVDVDYLITLAGYDAPGTYPEDLHAYSSTPDSDPNNNDATQNLVIGAPQTDLAVAKTPMGTTPNPNEPAGAQHGSFVAGGPFSYQVTVQVPGTGVGYADAQDVVVADTLPLGFVAQNVSTSRGACSVTPGTDPQAPSPIPYAFACQLGTVAGFAGAEPPQPVTITVTGLLDPQANDLNGGDWFAEQVPNTAVVTTSTPLFPDPATGPRTEVTATAAVDVIEQADLQLIKTPDEATVNAGGTIGYTLTVINVGPSGVEHAVVTDSLPVGFALDPTSSGCAPPGPDESGVTPTVPDGPGTEIAYRVGTVPAGQSVSIHIVAGTDFALAPGTATNTATVGSLATDPAAENNTTTADVTVARLTDLAISSSPSTTTPAAGQDVTFTGFTVNNGPSSAVNTRGVTVFPPGFVPVSVDVPFNTCTWSPQPPADPQRAPWQDVSYTLTCVPQTPGAAWEPGGAATNVVVMHVPGDTPAGTYSGSSTITSDTPEDVLDNNTTSQTLVVQHVSDTSVVKTLVEPDPMLSGRPATWRLTATNAGPSVADDLVISDAVPPGMTFTSAQIEGGAACPAPEADLDQLIVKCPVDQLGVGQSVSALVIFAVDAGTTGDQLCNTALVGSGSLDPDAADNESENCHQAAAPPSADVSLAISPAQQTLTPGSRVELTATVRNEGPGEATNVVATFDIPPGLTDYAGVAVEWPDGTTQPADCVVGSLTCTVGDLAPGTQVVYRIVGTAVGSPGASMTVTGTTTHGEPDPVAANDTAQAVLALTASPEPSQPGTAGGTPGAASGGGTLALTGTDVLALVVAALAAIGAGVALRLGTRRGRRRLGR